MGDENETTGTDDLDTKIQAALARNLNSAVKDHVSRAMKGFEKTMEGAIARAMGSKAPKADDADGDEAESAQPARGEATKAKPIRDKATDDRLAALERKLQDSEKARAEIETKARQDGARSELRSLLEKKGITGARARAVIADLELSNALRFDEDGQPMLALKRSRTKGAMAQEEVFDLKEGIEDWARSDDAKDFLPAGKGPAPKTSQQSSMAPRRGDASDAGTQPNSRRQSPQSGATDAVTRTMEDLAGHGIDLDNLARLVADD
jgi:hypothetical protein